MDLKGGIHDPVGNVIFIHRSPSPNPDAGQIHCESIYLTQRRDDAT